MGRFMGRGRSPRAIHLAIVTVIYLRSTGHARAAAPGLVTFAWSAPAGCPSQEQVEADIARLIGQTPRPHDGRELQADVTVSQGPLWSAELTTHQAGRIGHRSIEAPSCQAAAAAVALIIALSIDPEALPTTGRAAAVATAAVPDRPVTHPRQLRILASIHAQGRAGTLPGTDVGVGAGIGLAGARWRAELRWTYGLRRDQVAALPSGPAGRFNIAAGSLTGCSDLGGLPLALGPCAVAEVGRVTATGYGTAAGFSRDVLWLAAGAGVFSSLALSKHLHTSVEVDVLAPLYRPDFVFLDMPGVVFKAPVVGGRAVFELSWAF